MVLEVVCVVLEALAGSGWSFRGAGCTRWPSGVAWLVMEALKGI